MSILTNISRNLAFCINPWTKHTDHDKSDVCRTVHRNIFL